MFTSHIMPADPVILRLAVGLFAAAPSRSIHDQFATELARGMSAAALADHLVASAAFQSLYPAELGDRAFAAAFVASLLPEPQWREPATEWLAELLTGGTSRGVAAWRAITALLDATPAELTLAHQQFLNRLAVAEAYVAADGSAATLSAMRDVVASVTADPASVPAAIAAFTPPKPDAWTLMIYMSADNDLERYAINDLNELEALTLPTGVNIVVVVDRSPSYDRREGDWSDTRVGILQPDRNISRLSTELESVGEWNMGEARSLTRFIDWAVETRPAQNYGLVLWGHGSGITGVAQDGSSGNDWLTPSELRLGIDQSHQPSFAFIGFDSCLMAGVEIAAALAGRADIMLASQEEEPGEGWNYTRWLSQVFADGQVDAQELALSGINAYRTEYAGRGNLTLSAIDPDGYGSLMRALDDFAAAAQYASTADWRLIQNARRVAPDFSNSKIVDLVAVMQALGGTTPALADAAQQVTAAVQAMVIDHSAMMANTHGLSIHWPEKKQPWNFNSQYDDSLVQLVGTAAWREFLDAYWTHLGA